jgi:hypothetical protein
MRRRDARVLKDHAWKLAICDGVLQISITVAKPTSAFVSDQWFELTRTVT